MLVTDLPLMPDFPWELPPGVEARFGQDENWLWSERLNFSLYSPSRERFVQVYLGARQEIFDPKFPTTYLQPMLGCLLRSPLLVLG